MGTTVCIGGLIAVGKTTFIDKLVKHCLATGIRCRVMAEMYSGAMREMVSTNLPVADAFMMAHRLQMAVDAPDVAKNYDVVLMERCFIDHLAFQDAFVECNMIDEYFAAWSRRVVQEMDPPIPEHCVFLDVDPNVACQRKIGRGTGGDGIFRPEFMAALQRAYRRLIAEYFENPIVLDWKEFGEGVCVDELFNSILTTQCSV